MRSSGLERRRDRCLVDRSVVVVVHLWRHCRARQRALRSAPARPREKADIASTVVRDELDQFIQPAAVSKASGPRLRSPVHRRCARSHRAGLLRRVRNCCWKVLLLVVLTLGPAPGNGNARPSPCLGSSILAGTAGSNGRSAQDPRRAANAGPNGRGGELGSTLADAANDRQTRLRDHSRDAVAFLRLLRQLRGGTGDRTDGTVQGTEGGEVDASPDPNGPPPPPPLVASPDLQNPPPGQRRVPPPPPPPPLPPQAFGGTVRDGSDAYEIYPPPPWPDGGGGGGNGAGGPFVPPPLSGRPPPAPYAPAMDPDERGSPSWIAMDPSAYPPPPPPPYSPSLDQEAHQHRAAYDEYFAQQQQHQLQLQDQGQYYEAQILNLTSTIEALEQREALRARQLDAVTGRILEVEALFAASQLAVLECRANCTDLAAQRDRHRNEVGQLERQAEEERERSREHAAQLAALNKDLVAAKLQAEELALLIERHRIRRSLRSDQEEDDDEEDDETLMYRGSRRYSRQKKIKKKQGFWAWVFGWGSSSSSDDDGDDFDQRDIDDAYATARSTLLTALQAERNSVHELEAAVASLQQNNSAISEQVKSRDLIVDELNDRIAVFEEDKMVLKAALKQLQKDLNAEAPKTQELVRNLEAAQVEVKRLKKEMKGLIATHQEEVAALRDTISTKEDSLAMTESNLTVIGTYVDRLESRLAEFALVRREIEIREGKCQEIEQHAEKAEQKRIELEGRVKELQSEHEELRTLLRELADERAKLLSKNQDLVNEIKTLKAHDARVQEALAKLNSDYGELVVADMTLQHKLDKFEKESLELTKETSLLEERLASSQSNLAELRKELESEQSVRQTLLEQLETAEYSSKQLEQRLERERTLNAELSQNATRIQQEFSESLSKKTNPSIRRDQFSIHLSDFKPSIRLFGGKVLGSTVRDLAHVPANPFQQRAKAESAESSNATIESGAAGNSSVSSISVARPPIVGSGAVDREPTLNHPQSLIPIPAVNANDGPNATSSEKPFRPIRKAFAKATGLHGAFTKDYKTSRKRAPLPLSKGPYSTGSTKGHIRIPQSVQGTPQHSSQNSTIHIRSSRPNLQANAASANTVQRHTNTTKQLKAPQNSLLKPGYPVFGRQQGASVPPPQLEKRSAPPPPPPPPPPGSRSTNDQRTAPDRKSSQLDGLTSNVLPSASRIPKAQQEATLKVSPPPSQQVRSTEIPVLGQTSDREEPTPSAAVVPIQSPMNSKTNDTTTGHASSHGTISGAGDRSSVVGAHDQAGSTKQATTATVPVSSRVGEPPKPRSQTSTPATPPSTAGKK